MLGMFGDMFYPTPKDLADKMIRKINKEAMTILEPSAGKGDLIKAINESYKRYGINRHKNYSISAIEINPMLQDILRNESCKVIDSDFLAFDGPDKFDLIIANPPFDKGLEHLNKALDIMFCGQIIFLLNAETLKNPCSLQRKALAVRLKKLGAEIEFIKEAFTDSERTTEVEIALINVTIHNQVEESLFKGVDQKAGDCTEQVEDPTDLVTDDKVDAWIAEYNDTLEIGLQTITVYYKNHHRISGFLKLNDKPCAYSYTDSKTLTHKMQAEVNSFTQAVRESFWKRTLALKEVSDRLTSKKTEEFHQYLNQYAQMDFTRKNITQFVLNVIRQYPKMLSEAIQDLFDKFSQNHAYDADLHIKNTHYFNGWKTNKAYRINHKVIVPLYELSPFDKWRGLDIGYKLQGLISDMDLVMNSLSGEKNSSIHQIKRAFEDGQTSKIQTYYYTLTFYKKGTMHIIFEDKDLLRRFNIEACKSKEWLPSDYGTKQKKDLNKEQVCLAIGFEEGSYKQDLFTINPPESLKLLTA